LQKIAIIAYNMKGCLRFYTFIFWISPNLAKYTFGIFTFEQHCKIEKKKRKKNFNVTWVMKVFFSIRVSLNHLHYCVNEIGTNLQKNIFLLSLNSTNFAKICKNSPNFLYHKIINNFIKKIKIL
jgi:hypothetical protein